MHPIATERHRADCDLVLLGDPGPPPALTLAWFTMEPMTLIRPQRIRIRVEQCIDRVDIGRRPVTDAEHHVSSKAGA
jgi:hypothetical protein